LGTTMTRRPHDQYFTPASACGVLKAHWQGWKRCNRLLDPCVGQGDIVNAFPERVWHTCDLDPMMKSSFTCDMTIEERWLRFAGNSHTGLFAAISNPPFNCAFQIIQNAVKYCNKTAMLLRLSFLEPTRERGPWLAANPPDLVIVLPRISFTGDGKTDSVTCAWMIWDKEIKQKGVIVSPK
jgi:hypothetical protein